MILQSYDGGIFPRKNDFSGTSNIERKKEAEWWQNEMLYASYYPPSCDRTIMLMPGMMQ